jgi:cytidyltransferase-like protein
MDGKMTDTASQSFGQQHKILSMAQLAELRERCPDRKIILCHGAFDLVHMGHLIHFQDARSLGDLLVVTVTADNCITKKRSVLITEEYRLRQLAALEVVDYVALVNEPSAATPIEALKPDVYVKGPEYANLVLDKSANIFREKALVELHGGRIHFTAGETFSSTKLSHFLLASPEASQENPLLRNDRVLFRDLSALGFTLEQIKSFIVAADQLRICLIGETIIDEWVEVTATNLSMKSRCVAGIESSRTRQIGGTGAIALHLAGFVKELHCFTNGLSEQMPPNVTVTELSRHTLVKTRFVDRDNGSRLFESKSPDLTAVPHYLLPDFDDFDLVLISDFGHGLLDAATINEKISRKRRSFVAAMAQVNSSNFGYNLPIKYRGADYYSLNRTEAELCLRQRGLPLEELLGRMAQLLEADTLSVTGGDNGVMVRKGETSFPMQTLSRSIVDTVGCGDAYFALSSIAACLDLPAGMIALSGSIGAAAVAQRCGNETPVSENEFMTIAKIVI